MSPLESDSDLFAHKEFLGSNCGVFLPSPPPVEVPAPLGISVRRGAAEPSRALQGPTAHPGVGHSAWSAQRAFTAPQPPPTTRIVLKVLTLMAWAWHSRDKLQDGVHTRDLGSILLMP